MRQNDTGPTDQCTSGTEWFIHRFECPDCGTISRADRAVKCFRCGSQMEHVERIGAVYVTGSDQR